MKCNISRFRFLFFSLLFSFSFILIAPIDNTYATRLDVDVNHLDNYFDRLWPVQSVTFSSDHIYIGREYGSRYRAAFHLTTDTLSSLSCSEGSGIYSYIIYGDGWSSFTPYFNSGSSEGFISGSYNSGIVYVLKSFSDYAYFAYGQDGSYLVPYSVDLYFTTITLGCSAEEVAPQTPTPTPTEEPTPTPTAEPTPTPTVSPDSTVNPNDYEYNQMEDTAVRYSFYAFCIICLSAFLIYEIIIKRIILK